MVKKTLLIISIILAIQLVSAATIFSDTFEDGSISDWTTTGGAGNWHVNNTGPIDPPIDSWHMISSNGNNNPVYAEKSISTSGYQSIVFSFYYKPDTNDLDCADGDFLRGEWYDGSGWNTILDICGNVPTSYTLSTNNLNSAANNNLNFKIRFGCRGGAITEGCAIDNVSVNGTLIPDSIPPIATINFPTNNAFYKSTLNFNVSLNENGSIIFSLNGGISNKTMLFTTDNISPFGTLFNYTNNSIADGTYTFQVYANDTTGNKNYTTTAQFTYDTINPALKIIQPQNTTYSTNSLQINFTISDINLNSCWYTDNNGQTNTTLTNCQNTSYTANQGSTTIKFYANDSANNINNSEQITFFIDSITPLISFTSPTQANNSIIPQNSIFINTTITETNFANITFTLHNSTSLVNISTFTSQTLSINFTSLPDGIYFYNVTIKDTLNNQNTTETKTITIDTTSPALIINSPQNITYTNSTILINITSNGDNIWFYNGTANETYTSPIYRVFSQGTNTIIVYTNDSVGNTNSSSVTFSIDSITPSLSIITPIEGTTFGTNTSLELNFSVSDTNLRSCWYHIDSSNNITIPNCVNTTFNTSSGSHTLYLYANDTLNNKKQANVNFTISLGAPTITLIYPIANSYVNSQSTTFNFTAADITLQACELWGNFTGTFAKNQTNDTLVPPSQQISFPLTLQDSSYTWNILCNDTLGNTALTGNRTFTIDTAIPSLIISEPTGTKTSRNNIPLTFSVTDNNLNACWYNLYRGSSLEITNTTISCLSAAETFNVTVDASFTLNLYANDSAGNTNLISSSFTIDTSTPSTGGGNSGGGSSGSGGGSSSGGVPIKKKNETLSLSIYLLEQVAIKRGTNTTIGLEITNNAKKFANNCKLIILPPLNQFIINTEIKGLSPGEKFTFTLPINIPLDAEIGRFNSEIIAKCDEGQESTNLGLIIYRNSFEAHLTNYERESDKLKVSYVLEEFSQKDHEIQLTYKLTDTKEILVLEGNEKITLKAGERQENILQINIPKGLVGEFNLKIILNDSTASNQITEKLDLGKLTGFAISEENRRTLSKFGLILISILGIFFASRLTYKYYQNKKIHHFINKIEEKHGRKLIRLDIKHRA